MNKEKVICRIMDVLKKSKVSSDDFNTSKQPFFLNDNQPSKFKIDFNVIENVPEGLNRNIKLIYDILGTSKKEIYINDFLLLIDLEKQIIGDKFRILQDLAIQVGVSFRNKKLYPYILLKEYELDKTQLEKFERITNSLNDIKAPDGRTIIEIHDMLDEKKSQSGATGHQIGTDFENLIERTPDLQEHLVRTVDELEPGSYTTYFNYTNITSDIDMTVVKK